MSLLEVDIDSVTYGRVEVLRQINLVVDAGEMVAVLGNNGVGKTTLLRSISGVEVQTKGRLVLDGVDIGRLSGHERSRRGLIHVPEGRRVFRDLTVEENLRVGGLHAHVRDRDGEDRDGDGLELVYELFPALRRLAERPAGGLSGGEQQMLAVGRGLMARPRVLMIDEASLGLAPLVIHTLFESLGVIRESGVALLVVEQNIRTSLTAADRGYVLERGTVVRSGLASELLADPHIIDSYLGSADVTGASSTVQDRS